MGAIVAANCAAKARTKAGLIGTVAFLGTLCLEEMLKDPDLPVN